MHTKLIRKVASILMLIVIMSSTLADPISNVTQVIASTTDESTVVSQEATTSSTTPATDTSTSATPDDASITDTQTPSDTSTTDDSSDTTNDTTTHDDSSGTTAPDTSTDTSSDTNVDSSDSTTPPDTPASDTTDTTNSDTDLPDNTNDNASTSDTKDVTTPSGKTTTSPTTTKSSINLLAEGDEPPATCVRDGGNSHSPHLTVMKQVQYTNDVIIVYGPAGEPDGYDAKWVRFYEPSDDYNSTNPIVSTVKVQGGNFDFNSNAAALDAYITVPPDTVDAFYDNYINNEGLQMVVYFLNPTTGACTYKISNTAHYANDDSYVPTFPNPGFTTSAICESDCDIKIDYPYNAIDYPTGTQVIIKQDSVPIYTENAKTSAFRTHTYTLLDNPATTLVDERYTSHTYSITLDFSQTNLATHNFDKTITSQPITLHKKPVISSFSASSTAGSGKITANFNINLGGYTLSATQPHNKDTADVWVMIDGVKTYLTSSDLTSLGEGNYSVSKQINATPGSHNVSVGVDYSSANCSDSKPAVIVDVNYSQASFMPSRVCDNDCKIHFTFSNIGTGYSTSAIIRILDETNTEIASVNLFDEGGNQITSTDVVLSTAPYESHTYKFYVDSNASGTKDSFEPYSLITDPFILYQKPDITNFTATSIPGSLNITSSFNINIGGFTLSGNQTHSANTAAVWVMIDGVKTYLSTSDFTNLGSGNYSVSKSIAATPGPHNVVVGVDYGSANCVDSEGAIPVNVNYAQASFTPSRVCDNDCKVHFTFNNIETNYPHNAVIRIFQDSGLVPIASVNLFDVEDNQITSTDVVLSTAPYAPHTYKFYVDSNVNGTQDTFEPFSPTTASFTLYQKPDITDFAANSTPGSLNITSNFNINLGGFTLSGNQSHTTSTAVVWVMIDGVKTYLSTSDFTNLGDGNYSISKSIAAAPGPHNVVVGIDYGSADCVDTEVAILVNVNYAQASFTPSRVCDNDCKVHFAFNNIGTNYPHNAIIRIFNETNTEIASVNLFDEEDNQITSTDVVLSTAPYAAHTYKFYVDSNANGTQDSYEPFSPTTASFTLYQKPDITNFAANSTPGSLSVTSNFNINLGGFTLSGNQSHSTSTAAVWIMIDGVKTYLTSSDLTSLGSGNYSVSKSIAAAPGPHNVVVGVDYGSADCIDTEVAIPVNVNYAQASFTPSRVCDNDCKVHFTFNNIETNYPHNAIIRIFQDSNAVPIASVNLFDEEDNQISSTDVVLSTAPYAAHTYKFYVDSNADGTQDSYEPFSPTTASFTLYQKPDITNFAAT